MRPLTILLLSGLSLASIAGCTRMSSNTYPTTVLAATCPEFEGYPGCHSGSAGGATATAEALAAPTSVAAALGQRDTSDAVVARETRD